MTQSSQLKSKDSVFQRQSESVSKGGTSLPAISLKRRALDTIESALVQRVAETQLSYSSQIPLADIKPFQLKSELKSGTEPEHMKPYSANRTIQRKNDTGLPDALKSGIEALSNYSMDDVKVHYNSDKPAQLQALAYAQGTDIHLAPGQEKHLPHEAWHVVQQKQQRVSPSLQLKGINVNDDRNLENEADLMGAKAAQLKLNGTQAANSQGGNGLKDGAIRQPVAQGVFNLIGTIYNPNNGGELGRMVNALANEEHKVRLRKIMTEPAGARILAMGAEQNTYDLIETLMNIQSDEEYKAYLGGTKGQTFQKFDEDAVVEDKYARQPAEHAAMLANFPGHISMPYEDRFLNKSEFESSYKTKYDAWSVSYQPHNHFGTRFQGGAEGSAIGRNMIVDQYSWRDVEATHKAKDGATHRTAGSGSGAAENNKWYKVYDLLVNNPKAAFNYHIGVLENELPYRKMKNLDTRYKVHMQEYAVSFTNGSGDELNTAGEYTIRRAADKKVVGTGRIGELNLFKAPINCEINFKDFGTSWLFIDPATRYLLPGGYGVDFLEK